MELILHFSVHCANIRVFGETTKFWGGVFDSCSNLPQIKVYHEYSVPTILQVVTPFYLLKKVIFCSSLQYRSALVTTRMRNILLESKLLNYP